MNGLVDNTPLLIGTVYTIILLLPVEMESETDQMGQ